MNANFPSRFHFSILMKFKRVDGGGHPDYTLITLRYLRFDTALILPESISMANTQDEMQLAESDGTSIPFFSTLYQFRADTL